MVEITIDTIVAARRIVSNNYIPLTTIPKFARVMMIECFKAYYKAMAKEIANFKANDAKKFSWMGSKVVIIERIKAVTAMGKIMVNKLVPMSMVLNFKKVHCNFADLTQELSKLDPKIKLFKLNKLCLICSSQYHKECKN